jgi:hypothetical protein
VFPTKYLFHILLGSWTNLKTIQDQHPASHLGALLVTPATTSKLPPTPMINGVLIISLYLFRNISFLGEVIATNKMSASLSAMSFAISSSSALSKYPFLKPAITDEE